MQRVLAGQLAFLMLCCAPLIGVSGRAQTPASAPMRFSCAAGKLPQGIIRLDAASLFHPAISPDSAGAAAYGFDLRTLPTNFTQGACASDKPFFFSVAVPDGNYRVQLELGGSKASVMTVRAESRRLMVLERRIAAGSKDKQEFVVNVRTADIQTKDAASPMQQVRLKPREIGALDWDNKLTLEFNGEQPSVRSITITPVNDIPTVYLAGDSTVVDQDKEPWAAWGQMLPAFFGPHISIANNAESGETIKSFVGERRLDKVMSTIKAGDFLMIQFAHNDQKGGAGYVPAATDYKDFLRRYIAGAREHGATPILVTSMNRRTFGPNGQIKQTLGDYPQAMRDVAGEQHVALIDLNAMSKTLFEAMGEEGTLHAFVHYPAHTFPGQETELKDDTHFNAYGAYELARCVVQSIRDENLPLASYLKGAGAVFQPSKPDALAEWHLPASPEISTDTPYGR